jgi:anti-sigma factor RsiW
MEIERMSAAMTPDDDALLVAFLDDALDEAERDRLLARLEGDAALRARLEALRSGGLPFAPAFEALLEEAPLDRLRASLAAAPAREASPAGKARVSWPRRRALAAALAVAVFLAGLAAGRLAPPWPSRQTVEENREDWRDAVAQYMSLYTADTFASAADDPAARAADLTALGQKLGVALTPDRVALSDLTFERAELLSYDQAPLGQLAYLDAREGPVLFCILSDSRPDAPVDRVELRGFAAASWAHGGRGFMVIGRLPAERIAQLATGLAQRF